MVERCVHLAHPTSSSTVHVTVHASHGISRLRATRRGTYAPCNCIDCMYSTALLYDSVDATPHSSDCSTAWLLALDSRVYHERRGGWWLWYDLRVFQ